MNSGNRYEGDFFKGNRTGKGVFYHSNGSIYEGTFLDNQIHGKATVHKLIDEGIYSIEQEIWQEGKLKEKIVEKME